ncbi:MAG: hypothetical protein WC858_01710 [Parcubacteria group bacterium]|jgi:hypothetical protein
MKTENDKKLFLENLKKIPIIQAACERSGVSRASVYRWRNEDEKFAKALEESLAEGEALINDLSEGQLISLIKDKSFSAIRFWLNHRHDKFRERMELTTKIEKQEELTPEQEETVREALRLASLDEDLNINSSRGEETNGKK